MIEPSTAYLAFLNYESAKTWAYEDYKRACENADRGVSQIRPHLEKGLYDISALVKILTDKGFDHRGIAKHLRCSPSSVSRWRNGRPCKFKALQRILTVTPSRYWSEVTQVV